MSSHSRKHMAAIRSLLIVWLLFSGSALEAQIAVPTPVSPTTEAPEAPSQSKDSSDDSELKIQNYQLKHAKAAEVLKLWKQLHGIKNGATIDERTNSIVFFANDEAARELGESLALLDSETPSPIIPPVAQGSSPEARVPAKTKPAGLFRKYTFKHAKAAAVLKILREAAGADFDSDDMEGFVVDERTNSFIWKISDVSGDFEKECMKLDTKSPEEDVQVHNQERYERVPVIGPTTEGGVPIALDPPSDDEVMHALEKARATRGGIPLLFEKHRNKLQIVKEKIADYVDPPSEVPTIGMAQLHHAHYKCTIYLSERTINGWSVPYALEDKEASEVIYIDHNHFHKCSNGPTPVSPAPQASQTFNFSLGFGRGESLDSLKQRYSELEQKAHQLADKLKQSTSLSESDRIELQQAVRKSFEARQALQRAELADLAQRMKSMQQSIDMRDKLADKVVERRVEDLLNPSLKWNAGNVSEELLVGPNPGSSDPASPLPSNVGAPHVPAEPETAKAVSVDYTTWKSAVQLATSKLLLAYRVPPNIDPNEGPKLIALIGVDYQGKQEAGDLKEEIYEWIEDDVPVASPGRFTLLSRRFVDLAMMETKLRPSDLASSSPSFLENRRRILEHFRRHDVKLDSLLITSLKHIGDSDKTRQNQFEVTLEGFIDAQTSWFERVTLKGKANGPLKEPESNSLLQFATPQELFDAVDQHGKSGSYEDFVKLFNDGGARDLAGSLLMQAVMQTSIEQTFGGLAEVDPNFVAFRKVLQRWLPQSVTTAQLEAMGKGLSIMMSSIGGASPDPAAMKEFVISLRESVERIGDHRKFCIEIMQAFEKLTTRKFVLFGNADNKNEWQISPFGDRAIATLIDGSPGMATTITLQQANGTWRISSLFNELVIEAQPATPSPISKASIASNAKTVTRRYSVGSFVTKSFFNRGGLIYDKPLYDQYESQIEQSLQELEKTLAAVCTQPPRFVSIERDSRSLLIGHTAEGHDEIASFMRDIGVNNDRIRLRGDVLIIKSDQAKTLGIDLSQHVLTPNELEKLHEFAISDSSKQNKQELSKTNHLIVAPRPLDETLESGVRIAMRHSGLIPLTIAAIVSDGKQIQLRFDTHLTENEGRSGQVVLSLFQVLGDGESVLLPILEDKFYVLLTADIVRESKSSVNEKEEAAKARQSSSLPAKHDANVDLAVFDWSDLLKLLPESGTVLWMFSHEPDKREQMLPIAEKVAEEASVKLIHLPIDNWRTLFSKEATHFVLMKDRQLIGTKTGLVTEVKLKEFVAQAKDWLTPKSTGVSESSLVRVDSYISPGNDNIGSQHGPAIPITLAVVAIDGDEALLFGTEGIAKYLEKGCACVAIVRDEKGNEKQVPLEVVLTGKVPLKKPDALNDDDAPVITIPFFKYDKENIELQEAYDLGSAIYRIRGAHGLTAVKLATFDNTPQKGERVLAGEFNSRRHHGPIHRFQSPFHWQTQQNLSESDWPIYGANHHGAKMFQVLCPTIPAPSSFLFNAHGRLIGTHGLGNLTEKDKTYTALMPYAIHSVLQAGLETIDHAGLKTALTQTLEESASAPAEPKYSSHPISWCLDSYWDNATASSKTDENTIQEYVASEAIRKLREKPECKAAIEAALAKWFASVEHEVNEIQLVRAAKCFVTAAGPEYQELAVDYLCKIWSQLPTLSLEKQIERLGEETELNDLLKQLVLNDELAIKFAERLTNGTSGDRSLVTYYLFSSTVLKDEKDPKVAELNTWFHNHRELFFPAFTAALKDESEQVRWFSLASLIGLDPKHASILSTITSVIESDASPKVRGLAIGMFSTKEMLAQVKSQNIEIAPLMIKTLEHDSSIDVRYAALEVLMAMDTESEFVHKNLMEWAKSDECEKVKYSLDLTLRNYQAGDRPRSIDELTELLSDPQWGSTIEVSEHNWSTYHRWARQYAIAILERYGAHAHRAIPSLEAELARNNKDTLSFATEAIDSVRGYCPGFPIEKLQGQWEFVSIQKPEGSTSFFDLQAASDQQPASVITVNGTQLKLGDRVLGEISHHRGSNTRSFAMLLDPDGKKRHCNGSIGFDGEYEINRAPEPEWLKLEVYELLDNWDAEQATKQIYEFRPVKVAP